MVRVCSVLLLVSLGACAPKRPPPTPTVYGDQVHLLRHRGIAQAESVLGIPPLPGTRAHVAELEERLGAGLTTEAAASAGRGSAPRE